MDGAAPAHAFVGEEDTGAVFPDSEGVLVFHIPFSHLAVALLEMPGNAIDIFGADKQ